MHLFWSRVYCVQSALPREESSLRANIAAASLVCYIEIRLFSSLVSREKRGNRHNRFHPSAMIFHRFTRNLMTFLCHTSEQGKAGDEGTAKYAIAVCIIKYHWYKINYVMWCVCSSFFA
jgi:hypothetical protein